MIIKQLQLYGQEKLYNRVFNPYFESDHLLAHVLKKDLSAQAGRAFLYAHPQAKISKLQVLRFKKLIARRRKKEPFAYLVGEKEFYGLKFKITPDVLIPRHDTQLLVDLSLSKIKDKKLKIASVIDVGTGSGAVIVSIAHALKRPDLSPGQTSNPTGGLTGKTKRFNPNLIATDISDKALKIARANARRILGPGHGINFVKGDLLTSVVPHLSSPVILRRTRRRISTNWITEQPDQATGLRSFVRQLADQNDGKILVVANLPYLTLRELKNPELKFEPPKALLGGKKGLVLIEKLISQFARAAIAGDCLMLEIGYKQAQAVKKLVDKYLSQAKTAIVKDESGFDRTVIIES